MHSKITGIFKTRMNRIILIGNGFDLAHGLKTGYKHFIDWLWEKIKKSIPDDISEWDQKSDKDGKSFLQYEKNEFVSLKNYSYQLNYKDYDLDLLKKDVVFKNKFFEAMMKEYTLNNWVDIEGLYFQHLVKCKNDFKNDRYACTVTQLNNDFSQITEKLKEYLQTQKDRIDSEKINQIPEITSIIDYELEDIKDKDKRTDSKKNGQQFEGKTLFLNFNYTNTEELYLKDKRDKSGNLPDNIQIIHIHGELDPKKDNPVIFGYGDEKSDESQEIENLNNNEFLKYVKSTKYTLTINNELLKEFSDLGEFEIFVFGHSCGNSDRTLLRELFENDKCKNIRCFFHKYTFGTDNYEEISQNIYRNFDKKDQYRKKIVSKIKSLPLPQHNDGKRHIEEMNMVLFEPKGQKVANNEWEPEERTIEKSFYMGKYQVTQKEWKQIMGNNPSAHKEGGDDLPVDSVSWYDAVDFCNELSEKYGLKAYYHRNGDTVTSNAGANGFRLPAEAEWQYAAENCRKDGIKTPVIAGWAIPVHDKGDFSENETEEIKKYAWFDKNSRGKTRPVGKKGIDELKVFDMSGNVWEWCEDWYKDDGSYRVLRGGGWYGDAGRCRVSYRGYHHPDYRDGSIGFRLVCSL